MYMFLKKLFQRTGDESAFVTYGGIVAQARQSGFYTTHRVPDTLEGRFEMLMLHAFLVLHRLKAEDGREEAFSQDLFDTMFDDLDRTLREMGVGDLSVGKRIKKMASMFYGRMAAYDTALKEDAPSEALEEAIGRNVYAEVDVPDDAATSLARYVRESAEEMGRTSVADIKAGKLRFANVEEGADAQ